MADWAALRCQMCSSLAGRQGHWRPAHSGGRGDNRSEPVSRPGCGTVCARGHPPSPGTHLARAGRGGSSRCPGAGSSPLSRCLAPGRAGSADGPRASWARRLGVRAGRLQPCAGAGAAPRLAPRSGIPATGAEGLPALALPAGTRTGAGTRVSEEKARQKDPTASWNTFPCLERKRSEEREGGKNRVSWNHMVASHRQPLPPSLARSLARSLLPPSQRSGRAGRRPGSRGGRARGAPPAAGGRRGDAAARRPVVAPGARCGVDPVGESKGHLATSEDEALSASSVSVLTSSFSPLLSRILFSLTHTLLPHKSALSPLPSPLSISLAFAFSLPLLSHLLPPLLSFLIPLFSSPPPSLPRLVGVKLQTHRPDSPA